MHDADADADADRQRLTALWVEHADAVRRFARRRIEVTEVEDVVAETFAVTWRRIDQVPATALPWIYAVARNVIGTRLRSEGRKEALLAKVAAEPAGQMASAEVEAVERLHLAQAWSQLTEAEREVIALVAWEGLSSTEAATVMQCLPSTFAVRLLRARRRLAHLLDRGTGEGAGPHAGSLGEDEPAARSVKARGEGDSR
ncbi:RNA polymerase sigma factor [Pseudactinotalea sp. Z1739]|uniref:RNA polymerase sigma factor n=1 Tax=Pseudactinotalea sp. Z1739 TaxID=3413028 RepID=UPI003C7E12A7